MAKQAAIERQAMVMTCVPAWGLAFLRWVRLGCVAMRVGSVVMVMPQIFRVAARTMVINRGVRCHQAW